MVDAVLCLDRLSHGCLVKMDDRALKLSKKSKCSKNGRGCVRKKKTSEEP